MMWASASNASTCGTYQKGYFEFAVRDVVNGRCLLHNFAHCLEGKIQKHDVYDWMTSRQCCPDTHAGFSASGDGITANSSRTKLLPKATALLEISAARSDALPHIKDCWIAPHLFGHAFHPCLCIGDQTLTIV